MEAEGGPSLKHWRSVAHSPSLEHRLAMVALPAFWKGHVANLILIQNHPARTRRAHGPNVRAEVRVASLTFASLNL